MSTRRYWQIHLSTALVLMFVAGGLLFVNLKPRYDVGVRGRLFEASYGWPATFLERSDWSASIGFPRKLQQRWHADAFIPNAIWALIILIPSGIAWEAWIRRSSKD
jgi:hypothetical protein